MRVFPERLSRPALSKAGISGSNIAGRMGKTIGCPRSLPALVWFVSVSIIRRTRLLWTREDRMRTNCCKALVAVSALLLSAGIAGAAEVTAQCLNLEQEFHHTASKLCILGFEPLK